MRHTKTAPFFAAAAASLTLLGVSGAAHADLTVVTQTTTKGYPAELASAAKYDADKPVVTITYYKNGNERTETGKTIEIYNGSTNIWYTLNPDTKTYMETKGWLGKFLSTTPSLMGSVKLDNKTFVEAGGQTQTIAGQKTKNYKYLAIFTFSMPVKSDAAVAVSAGAEPSSEEKAALDQILPITMTIEGEDWAAEGLHTGLKDSPSSKSEFDALPYALPLSGPALSEYAVKKGIIKGFTLQSTSRTTFSFASLPSVVPQEIRDLIKSPIVTTTETKVVSTNSLDKALFAPPTDYKKVDAPSVPTAPLAAN